MIQKLLNLILILLILIIPISSYINSQGVVTINTTIDLSKIDSKLTIMSYNIHHGVDASGKSNLNKITEIINDRDIDIVGLNEVDRRMIRTGFKDQARIIAEKTGLNYVFGPNLKRFIGTYGNALLTRFPILKAENHPLPRINRNEPRGILDATLLLPNKQHLRVLVTHLSVDPRERRLQIGWIENYISEIKTPFFLLGDFNDEMTAMLEMEPIIKDIKTFPAKKPVNQIDYIFSNVQLITYDGKAIVTEASDHLPVIITGKTDIIPE